MSRLLTFAFGFLAAINFAVVSFAQTAMDETYGIGVHSYYSGNLTQADQIFNQLVDSGSQDPRVYYFRGVTQSRLTRDAAGKADFEKGADLEMQGKRAVDVGRALQRIQGRVRTEIEKARSAARLTYATKKMLLEKTRIEKLPAGSGVMPADPFADDPNPTKGSPQDMPKDTVPAAPSADSPATEPAEDDPFAAPGKDAPDPFGAPPADDGKPPATDADPFG